MFCLSCCTLGCLVNRAILESDSAVVRSRKALTIRFGVSFGGGVTVLLMWYYSMELSRVSPLTFAAATLFAVASLAVAFWAVFTRSLSVLAVEVWMLILAVCVLIIDFIFQAAMQAPIWYATISIVGMLLVVDAQRWALNCLTAVTVCYLIVFCVLRWLAPGVFNSRVLRPTQEYAWACDCTEPPCAMGPWTVAQDAFLGTLFFLGALHYTRSFADNMHGSVRVAERIAQCLARYDLDGGWEHLKEGTQHIPPNMRDAYETLLGNLNSFLPFLPQGLWDHLALSPTCGQSQVSRDDVRLSMDQSECGTLDLGDLQSEGLDPDSTLDVDDDDIPAEGEQDSPLPGEVQRGIAGKGQKAPGSPRKQHEEAKGPVIRTGLSRDEFAVLCVTIDALAGSATGSSDVADCGTAFLDIVLDQVDACKGVLHTFSDGTVLVRFGEVGHRGQVKPAARAAELGMRACRCATGLRDGLLSFAEDWAPTLGVPPDHLSPRIAVSSGTCCVGFLGARGRNAAHLLGPAVVRVQELARFADAACWSCQGGGARVVITSNVQKATSLRLRPLQCPGGLWTLQGAQRRARRVQARAKPSPGAPIDDPVNDFQKKHAVGSRVLLSAPPRDDPVLKGAAGVVQALRTDGGISVAVASAAKTVAAYPGGVQLIGVDVSTPDGDIGIISFPPQQGLHVVPGGCAQSPGAAPETPLCRIVWVENGDGRDELCYSLASASERVRLTVGGAAREGLQLRLHALAAHAGSDFEVASHFSDPADRPCSPWSTPAVVSQTTAAEETAGYDVSEITSQNVTPQQGAPLLRNAQRGASLSRGSPAWTAAVLEEDSGECGELMRKEESAATDSGKAALSTRLEELRRKRQSAVADSGAAARQDSAASSLTPRSAAALRQGPPQAAPAPPAQERTVPLQGGRRPSSEVAARIAALREVRERSRSAMDIAG
eukprot:TRINITY_DN50184_c0_g1_i1.p1 TRINITY_DN50184_c0_g1~~TRINITY_DN50184_c0_g1_i1.p1  ORF type:complete len:972 (+),score=298.51 TRINITY_DN50184_c0_g1_i1:93-2918(+)